jgi:hypothetical protein
VPIRNCTWFSSRLSMAPISSLVRSLRVVSGCNGNLRCGIERAMFCADEAIMRVRWAGTKGLSILAEAFKRRDFWGFQSLGSTKLLIYLLLKFL